MRISSVTSHGVMACPPQRGQIVKAEVLDPQGGNPKCRPLVIVTATEDIKPNQPFLAVAITGSPANPLPDDSDSGFPAASSA